MSFAPLVATLGKPLGNLCGDWLPGGTNQLIGELKLSVLPGPAGRGEQLETEFDHFQPPI